MLFSLQSPIGRKTSAMPEQKTGIGKGGIEKERRKKPETWTLKIGGFPTAILEDHGGSTATEYIKNYIYDGAKSPGYAEAVSECKPYYFRHL